MCIRDSLCTVESADARNRVENARLSLQNAELAASMAADSLDDYNITSQITGTVIEKNFKAGDKVEGMNSGSLAVVYDMSYLKLEMAVDELDISKVGAGQSVTITADAVEGQTFTCLLYTSLPNIWDRVPHTPSSHRESLCGTGYPS